MLECNARCHRAKTYEIAPQIPALRECDVLNEFLKEHHKVEDQEKRIDALTAQLKKSRRRKSKS